MAEAPAPAAPASSAGRTLRIGLKIGLSAALLALLLSQVEWHRAAQMLRSAQLWPLAALLVLFTADRVLMALKWHQLLRVLDRRLTPRAAIRVYYESSFVGFAMPLGGLGPDIVRYLRLRGRGIPPHVTLVSMLMERFIGLIATLVLVVVGLAALAALVEEPALRRFALLTAAAAATAAVLAAAALLWQTARRSLRRLLTLSRKVEQTIEKHLAAARDYAPRRDVLSRNFALSVIEQTTPVWAYWLGSRALETPLPLVVCLAVAPVTVVVQRLPISYAGLGLREGSAAALLVALGYDYSESLVLLMMLFVTFVVSLLPGAIVFKAEGARGNFVETPSARRAPHAADAAQSRSAAAAPDREPAAGSARQGCGP